MWFFKKAAPVEQKRQFDGVLDGWYPERYLDSNKDCMCRTLGTITVEGSDSVKWQLIHNKIREIIDWLRLQAGGESAGQFSVYMGYEVGQLYLKKYPSCRPTPVERQTLFLGYDKWVFYQDNYIDVSQVIITSRVYSGQFKVYYR